MTEERPGRPGGPGKFQVGSGGDAGLASLAATGIQFAAAILLFLFAGQWLDRRLGTEPLFLLLGVFLGAAGGLLNIFRRLAAENRRRASGDKHDRGKR